MWVWHSYLWNYMYPRFNYKVFALLHGLTMLHNLGWREYMIDIDIHSFAPQTSPAWHSVSNAILPPAKNQIWHISLVIFLIHASLVAILRQSMLSCFGRNIICWTVLALLFEAWKLRWYTFLLCQKTIACDIHDVKCKIWDDTT